MKIYIEKENALQIDKDTKLVLLNANEFASNIKETSSFVPMGHIKITLNYKLINNNNEYYGESIFDSYNGIKNNVDAKSPYKAELINWRLSDRVDKYLEFSVVKTNNNPKTLGGDFLKLIDVLWKVKEFDMFNPVLHLSIAYVLDNLYNTNEYMQKYNQLLKLAEAKEFNAFSWELTKICTDMVKNDRRTTEGDIDLYDKWLKLEEERYNNGRLTLFGLIGAEKAQKYAPNWYFVLFGSYMPLKVQEIENTIISYLKVNHSMSYEEAKKSYDKLYNHLDLLKEFYHYVIGEGFPVLYPKTVKLITAKQLHETERLSVLEAYNYLIYLRETPEEALKDLNKGLKYSEHYAYKEPLKK